MGRVDTLLQLLFCFLLAFLVLMICSANSFLYEFNDWVDLNWYITMGRGIASGKVMYKDLFDHKGPLLYLVFAFLALFPNPYIAVWLLEVVCFTLFLFLSYKIANRYLNKTISLVAVILIAAIVPTSTAFVVGGGAVEEFCLPILMYFLLVFLEITEDDVCLTKKRSLLIGTLLSVLFWVKFTLIVIPGIVMLVWLIKSLIKRRFKNVLQNLLMMLAGFVLVTIPIMIYFLANRAFSDLYNVYFYDNLFTYNGKPNLQFNFKWLVWSKVKYEIILLLIGFGFMTLRKNYLYTILLVSSLFYHIYMASHVYYNLPLLMFSFVGVVMLLQFVNVNFHALFKAEILIMALTICGVVVGTKNNTAIELNIPKESYVQYQVAEKIKTYDMENPTLFCYRMMDYGFYNAAGLIPQEKFYALSNFSYEAFPEMYEAQNRAVRECHADFVVLWSVDYDETNDIFSGYEFVDEYTYQLHEDSNHWTFNFTLLKKVWYKQNKNVDKFIFSS